MSLRRILSWAQMCIARVLRSSTQAHVAIEREELLIATDDGSKWRSGNVKAAKKDLLPRVGKSEKKKSAWGCEPESADPHNCREIQPMHV